MKTKYPLYAVLVAVAVSTLAACGGGGGGGGASATPTPVAITCPNGTTAADASLCQAAKVVSATSGTVSPDSFTGIVVVTDSTLDASTLTTANVTFKAGGVNAVAGTVDATAANGCQFTNGLALPCVGGGGTGIAGFKFVPTVKLNYGQAYTFTATVKDTLGRSVKVDSSIATALVTCVAPQVADSTGTACVNPPAKTCTLPAKLVPSINNCVTPVEVGVTNAYQLSVATTSFDQQSFKDAMHVMPAVASEGTDSSGQEIAWLFFKNTTSTGLCAATNGCWNVYPIYTKDGSRATLAEITGGFTTEIDKIWGSKNSTDPNDPAPQKGPIMRDKATGTCFQWAYDKKAGSWDNNGTGTHTTIACPK